MVMIRFMAAVTGLMLVTIKVAESTAPKPNI